MPKWKKDLKTTAHHKNEANVQADKTTAETEHGEVKKTQPDTLQNNSDSQTDVDKTGGMSKKVIIIVVLAILAAAGLGIKAYLKMKEAAAPMTLYGNIDIRQVNMAFRVAGRLNDMRFEEGDPVKAGDILATLDIEPIENKLNQAKAQLEQAKAVLQNAQIVYNRKISLCKTKDIATQECDDATARRDEALANVSYAEAVLDEAQTAYDDATLRTPSDGIILVRIYEPGSMMNAGLPVYSISLNDKMWARAYIKETDLGKVKIGTKMKIYTDSTDKVYDGHVGFISPQAEFTPKNIETSSLRTDLVYRMRIIIDNPDDYLKQGMPVTIRLTD